MKKFSTKKVVPFGTNESQTTPLSQERRPVNLELSSPRDGNLNNAEPSIEKQVKKPISNELYIPQKQIVNENYNNEVQSFPVAQTKNTAQFGSSIAKTTISRNAPPTKLIQQSHIQLNKENSFEIDEYPKKKRKFSKNIDPLKIVLGVILGSLALAGIILIIIGAIAPCVFKKCHPNATCINRPFRPKCKCIYGYNGNGVDDCDECGLNFPTEQTHLNEWYMYDPYGELLLPYAFPDSVYIKFVYQSVFQYNGTTYYGSEYDWCFGTIINRRFILTTAHCVPDKFEFSPYAENRLVEVPVKFNPLYPSWTTIVHVYIKLYDYIAQNYEITPSEMVVVEDVIYYKGFDYHKLDHDIALIKLKYPLKFDRQIQPSCIPEEYDLPMEYMYLDIDEPGITLGWNWYWNSSQWSYLLTDYHINIFPVENCSFYFPNITDTHEVICAGEKKFINANSYNCHGYPGSGLYMNKTVSGKKKRFVVGLSANESVCGIAAFTNLFYYSDWIHENWDY